MVDEDVQVQCTEDESKGNLVYTISSPKYKADFIVKKSNDGFAFFDVQMSVGQLPRELTGKYTSAEKGLEAVKRFLRKAKESKNARRDNMVKRREAQKNAQKLQSDNKEHVQQGTAN